MPSLFRQAYALVRTQIQQGVLSLGQVISSRKTAEELGMSFIPVSKAFLQLESEGFLESRQRAGTRVRIPTPEEVRGYFVLREALEMHTARIFSERATPDERREVKRIAAKVDELWGSPDKNAFREVHVQLHRRIAECARSAALAEAIDNVHALVSAWSCGAIVHDPSRVVRIHRNLARTVCGNDPDKASAAMQQHVREGLSEALRHLEPYFTIRKKAGARFTRKKVSR